MEGIRKVFIREAKRTRVDAAGFAYSTENEWMLDTEGVALLKVPPPPFLPPAWACSLRPPAEAFETSYNDMLNQRPEILVYVLQPYWMAIGCPCVGQ